MERYDIIEIMKLTIAILLLSAHLQLVAQDYKRNVITDPSISRRCNALLSQRNLKIVHKQKLQSLILRNEKLQSITPPAKITLKKKLTRNKAGLKHELQLTLLKIKNQEENLIRKGCPGINL